MSVKKVELEIQALLDGTLSEEGFARLQQQMASDPEVRQLYYRYVRLHQSLEMSYGGARDVLSVGEARRQRLQARYRRVAAWAAVAVLLIAAVALRSVYLGPEERLAYRVAPGGLLEVQHPAGSRAGATELEKGSKLEILQGTVELELGSGVMGWIDGPAEIEVVDAGLVKMPYGSGRFHVSDGAEGFTVETDEVRAVDLGTEFGVVAWADRPDELHVFSGRVAYEMESGAASGEVVGGQGVRFLDDGVVMMDAVDAEFKQGLPDSLRYAHWSFDGGRPVGTLATEENIHHWMENGGGQTLVDGVEGSALALGSDGAGALMTNWRGIGGDAPRSVAFWVKLPSAAQRRVDGTSVLLAWGRQQPHMSSTRSINSKWSVHLDHSEKRVPTLNVSFGGVWYHCPRVMLEDDQWHHVAIVYRGGVTGSEIPEVDVYYDGRIAPTYYSFYKDIEVDLSDDGRVVIDTESFSPLRIGGGMVNQSPFDVTTHQGGSRFTGDTHFTGWIDELFIIEGVIDKYDVWQMMNDHRYQPAEREGR
ncbi:hypothetical protein [Sulfuriroseicoccus oceanibius]|uniref:FecR protein n=1 Tax=Sulfuriroseicoccus oceanibius TaxID=2707525 RepID=A0A6B3L9V4_9BACT|nr:hypothetical protein [Sulfuriroseicoccus oceanibius]QQL43676.1 hypothetical protein G3M56_007115 [Sulfuriroseicoccus oceanibius]